MEFRIPQRTTLASVLIKLLRTGAVVVIVAFIYCYLTNTLVAINNKFVMINVANTTSR